MSGFIVDSQFNDTYAFRDRPAIREDTPWYDLHQTIVPDMSGAPREAVRRCAKCGELLAKWEESLTGIVVKKRAYDISCTYDGIAVVSQRFKEVCDGAGLTGLRFIPLPDDPTFMQIQASQLAAFDAESRGTRFIKQCTACGRYESVVGATPVFLKEGATIPENGFVRTDIEFASGDEKHPLLLCGPSAGKALRISKLKGLDLVSF